MGAMTSQIPSLTIVYSTVYSGADQRKHQSSTSLAFVREFTGDRWILRTNDQWCGKCFHLITTQWNLRVWLSKHTLQLRQFSWTVIEARASMIDYTHSCIPSHVLLVNSLAPRKFEWNFRYLILQMISVICWLSLVQLPWYECHWTSLMISQHWFRQWLGVVRKQAITWANVDPDLRRHMASLGHNELKRAPDGLGKLLWSLLWRGSDATHAQHMMTLSNGNIFRVTGHLSGEFTGHRWIPPQRPVTRSFDVFFDLRLNKRLSNNREAGDLRRHRAHYDVNVMLEGNLFQSPKSL